MKKLIIPAVLCCALMACGGAKTTFADFEKGDYKIYALRGKVSKVSYEYNHIAFNADGQVIDDESFLRIGKDGMKNRIVRDAKGNILTIDLDEEEFGSYLTYNDKGMLSEFKHTTDESEYVRTFTYNDDCEVVSEHKDYTYYYDDGMGSSSDYEYSILERDSHGNWIKAECRSSYFEEGVLTEEPPQIITRTIEYFE
ncbi:MAG: hypothetical protein MJZ61_08090 [Bacteroidales bacterium]|nr:hypothetical protein [Bacteroidales bacterium]